MKAIVVFIAALALMAGCVTYHLEPNELYEGQDIIFTEGYEAVIEDYSSGGEDRLTVSVFGYPTDSVIALHVFYGNATDKMIDVLPDRIALEGLSDQGRSHIKVWEANEYIRKTKRAHNTALVLQAIAAGLQAASAGTSSTSTYGSYYGSTRYGSFSGTYSQHSTTYDSGRVAEANARNAATIAAQADSNADNLAYLNAVLLKRNTLLPGHYISGVVYCDRELFSLYKISVPFGDRSFVFSFKLVEESY